MQNSAAYFDASGKQEGHPFLTVAGAASPIKKWNRFEKQWSLLLKAEGVSEFHATDFAASKGEYKDWKGDKPRRSAFVRHLLKIIKQNVNKLFMVTVEMPAWNEVNREYLLAETVHSPYALAGFTVAAQARRWAMRKQLTPSSFKVFFEDGDEGWGGLKQLCETYCNFEPIRVPKKEGIPFQIGDFLAWKTRITATNAMKIMMGLQRGDSLDELSAELKTLDRMVVCPGENGIYSPRALTKTCQNLKIPKRSQDA
jgi:hypothetical protein